VCSWRVPEGSDGTYKIIPEWPDAPFKVGRARPATVDVPKGQVRTSSCVRLGSVCKKGGAAMRGRAIILAVGAIVLGAGGAVGRAEADRADRTGPATVTFKPQLLPKEVTGLRSSWADTPKPTDDVPSGAEGVEAIGAAFWPPNAPHEKRQVILTKSSAEQKRYDRLYVDKNGNGRFESDECYDISRAAGAVSVVQHTPTVCTAKIHPLVWTGREGTSVCWTELRVQHADGRVSLFWTLATCMMAEMPFGDRRVRVALCPFESTGRYDRGVALVYTRGFGQVPTVSRGCRLLLDLDANGRFDKPALDPRAVGPESRLLTRFIRVEGRFYELTVAPDGRSVRATPVKPETGTLSIPAQVERAQLIGPAFATVVRGSDGPVELPVGRYSIASYVYGKGQDLRPARASSRPARPRSRARRSKPEPGFWCLSLEPKATVEIKAGQTTSPRLGPPLTLKVSYDTWRGPKKRRATRRIGVGVGLVDCAGRHVIKVWTGPGRLLPRRVNVIDQTGRTVLKPRLTYGTSGLGSWELGRWCLSACSLPIPADWQGTYRVVSEWPTCPFPIGRCETVTFRTDEVHAAGLRPAW